MPKYELNFKPYSRNLSKVLKTARGELFTRKGLILELKEPNMGLSSFGEAVILEHFGSESMEEAADFLKITQKELTSGSFDLSEYIKTKKADFPASTFALEAAMLQLEKPELFKTVSRETIPLSKLLSNGESSIIDLQSGLKANFQTFKWKLGIGKLKEEIDILLKLLSLLPRNFKLRIDANEGLSKDDACYLLEKIEGRQVEFLEQPFKRDKIEEHIILQENFKTPIALDESIATTDDVISAEKAGWRGVFAIKPLRLFELEKFLDWRETSSAKISYSTVLETPFGQSLGLFLAASDKRNKLSAGYGVESWYEKDEFSMESEEKIKDPAIQKFTKPYIDNEALMKIWQRI